MQNPLELKGLVPFSVREWGEHGGHLKVKDGRFHARVAVPAALRELVGRSELTAPLGGERRAALKLLPEAVAGLQRQRALAAPQVCMSHLGMRTGFCFGRVLPECRAFGALRPCGAGGSRRTLGLRWNRGTCGWRRHHVR